MTAVADEASEFAVRGMTCASCVHHVTRALERVPGVTAATVNLATERALVAHAPSTADAALLAAIEHAGYTATLVARDADADDDDAAIRRERLRSRAVLALGIALSVPTMLVAMLAPPFRFENVLLFALTLPVWGIVGFGFHRAALAALRHGTTTMDTLVSLGSTTAFAYAIAASFTGAVPTYETASAIITLVYLGKFLEAASRTRTAGAMRALLDLRPQTARVRDAAGAFVAVPIDRVRVGDVVAVPAGERIPVDGRVTDGASAIDVAMLTGEPIPHEVGVGDDVRAGTRNGDGSLVIRTTAVGRGTALARIVAIVRAAQGTTPPVQHLADRAAAVFVPIILAITGITFAARLAAGEGWPHALAVAVAVLVVACPCALGLATPTAIIVGVGVAARHGILVKDASALERLGTVRDAYFDKTGTLTAGRPEVVAVVPAPGANANAVLAAAAAVEAASAHPLASAIVRAARERGIAPTLAASVTTQRGAGVTGTVAGATITVASTTERPVATPDAATLVRVTRDGEPLGTIALLDAARPEAHDAVAALAALGVTVHVASGDAQEPVAALARIVGVAPLNARGRLDPEAKAALVREAAARGGGVLFVGDGINDAPALASADVGIAMGAGSDLALDVAGAALLGNDPRGAATAVRLSRAVMRTIRINLFWAFAYNAALVPLAAFGIVQPVLAAAAMGASSLFVVGNALLLRRFRAAA
jgi:Cu+-exporting ATPase